MDEATTSIIDYKTDTLLQEINYEKILVLDKGNIVEYDSPQILLKNKDCYLSKLYKESAI